jgi:hypothetical protein
MTTGVTLTALVYVALMCFAVWLVHISSNNDDDVK